MSLTAIFPGLSAFVKGEADDVSRYFVQGKGEIRLCKSDFKAQGGEGAIYLKGSTAYKIYSDPQRAISPAKIQELSGLTQPNIIRPLEVLLDGKNRAVGYSMRAVGKSYALCQLFPKAFRQRHNLTPEVVLRLVRRLQEGVSHVHAQGILIVDLNEMNFLVAEDFREIFFIDVDSYQTPSYPATALMESVRDRQAQRFTTGSDWFSFAVVSFQMFVGLHPFKGTYTPLQNLPDKETKLDARMRAGVSVLRPEVSVPASCLPFNIIPPAYLDWYRAIFEEGKRMPPPDNSQPTLTLMTPIMPRHPGSALFEITELKEFDSEVISHDGIITVTEKSIYFDEKRYVRPPFDVKVIVTPRLRHLVAAYMDGSRACFYDLTDARDITLGVEAEEIMQYKGQFYVKQQEKIFALEFIELRGGVLPGVKLVANVMMKSTRMFEGAAIQNLLGACYASVLPAPGVCHQIRLAELDGYQLVGGKLSHNVLIIVGAKEGLYDKLIFRFADDFSSYDLRIVANISSTSIDFTVLASGVVLHISDEDTLEVFSRRKGSHDIKAIQDAFIQADVRLFHNGAQALIARGSRLYKIRMRQ